jgi:hypothetical protein
MTFPISTLPTIASFGFRWGLPILVGSASGLFSIVFMLDLLAQRLGPIPGGFLAGVSGVAFGIVATLATAMFNAGRPRA